MVVDREIFKNHFSKIETIVLELLLKQYEWEVENCLSSHDIVISVLREIITERRSK